MKILLGYSYYPSAQHDVSEWVNNWINRLKAFGFKVDSLPLTVDAPGEPYYWKLLDKKWKLGDKKLLAKYEELAIKAQDYDVFLNWNGINIHPDFLRQLPTFNVYACFDDPDSSEILSKPVAAAYDLCLVGNIAEVDTYKSWGVKNAEFWPLGFLETDYNPLLTENDILTKARGIDITLLCEKKYVPGRISKLDEYERAFPNGEFYGLGWNKGFLKESQRIPLYQNTKIGPNFHNSTGPINFRTYTLPANGIMQICDNKSHLGNIFELNKEVVGFDSVKEAIELTRYYLSHDEERKRIAVAGWKRAIKDYNEYAVFGMAEKHINKLKQGLKPQFKTDDALRFLVQQRKKTFIERAVYMLQNKIKK